jgi:predicted RecA/RadA family phage recombinase
MKGFDPATGLGYIQEGDYVDAALPYARNSGEGVLIGALFGVVGGPAGVQGDIRAIMRHGLHGLVAASGANTAATAWTSIAYWDDTNKRITPISTSNTRVGIFAADKTTAQAFGNVLLD